LTNVPAHGRADRRPGLLDRPLLTALVGAVAGAAASAGLVLSGALSPPPPPPNAAPAFLAAWRAHLLASWSVDELEQRTTASGTIRFVLHEAQRPPDSVSIGGATIDARRGSTLIACATPPGATHPLCREQATTLTWAQMAEERVATIRATVAGPRRVYRVVATGPGCFRLDLVVPPALLAPAVPIQARYCFDSRTNALRSSTVRLADATDVITARSIRAPATDADLALPADATYQR
jgi:hypothetical protein